MSPGQKVNPADPNWEPRAPQTSDKPGAPAATPRVRWSRRREVLSVFAATAAFAFVVVYAVAPSGDMLAQAAPQAEASTVYDVAVDGRQSVEVMALDAGAAPVELGREGYLVALKPKPTPPPAPPSAGGSGGGGGWRPPFVVPDPGSAQAIGYDMVMARGWGDDQFACLSALWKKESGWRVNAHNRGSGAYGIPQALPGNKMASAGADWETNPATQISWGLGYISGRYGTPCGAWEKSQRSGWY